MELKEKFSKMYKEYEKYCLEHECTNKRSFYRNKEKCKYDDYNRGLIDGKIPCQDCKMAFAIDYMSKHK